MSADRISLRVAEQEDLEFLFSLTRASLGPYVEQTFGPWKDEEQRAWFFESTDPATHQVIELGGQAIGCLDVRWLPDQVKLNRIFLLPAHQNRGIGTQLVREVLSKAGSAGLPVRLRVFRVNHAARRFYGRFGFVTTGETDTHVLMEHTA